MKFHFLRSEIEGIRKAIRSGNLAEWGECIISALISKSTNLWGRYSVSLRISLFCLGKNKWFIQNFLYFMSVKINQRLWVRTTLKEKKICIFDSNFSKAQKLGIGYVYIREYMPLSFLILLTHNNRLCFSPYVWLIWRIIIMMEMYMIRMTGGSSLEP